MSRLLRLLALLLLLLAAGGGYWLWRHRPPLVEVAVVSRGPAVEAVYATGTVEPVRWAQVGPAVKGRLLELYADEGQEVEQGQALARLDDTAARAQVAEAEARAAFAASDADRVRALAARGTAARSDLERAESEARATAALADLARRRLDDYMIRSPITGRVLRREGEPGEIVDTNAAVFWIGEPRPLRVTAEVDEEDIPRVQPGQKALLKADAFPGRVLTGTVAQITPKGDPVQKTYRVRIGLPAETPLMIGMTIEANIVVTERDDAILVPVRAVRDGAVFVLDGQTVKARAIDPGITGPRMVEAQSGVAVGDAVVLDPPPSLADGQLVRRQGGQEGWLVALLDRWRG